MSRGVSAWLLVRAGGRPVGLPLSRVVEVLEPGTVHPAPSRDPAVLGITTIRDRILPVVDLATLLDGATGPAGRQDTAVVVELGRSRLCVVVEDADEVLLGAGLPVPAGDTLPWASAVARHGGRLIPLLDLDALGARLREAASA